MIGVVWCDNDVVIGVVVGIVWLGVLCYVGWCVVMVDVVSCGVVWCVGWCGFCHVVMIGVV